MIYSYYTLVIGGGAAGFFAAVTAQSLGKKVALGHEFINYLHDPEIAKENMNFTCYLCP